jgi:general stress protein YciG
MAATTSPRGFAAMSNDDAKAIQSKGGKSSPQNFKNNRALAKTAGKKGGAKSRRTS